MNQTVHVRFWRQAGEGDFPRLASTRRKRLDENGTIHYAGAYERSVGNGRDTTGVVTKYYQATLGTVKRLIALRRNGVLYFVGTDHLGSTVRVMDSAFVPIDQMRYKPYGESRDAGTNLNTDHLFTTQILDRSIGLYWYGSRAYDPAIGRFICPDSIVPEPGNPQALNRYSYALNNPLRYTDPTGHYADSDWTYDAEREGYFNAHGEQWAKTSYGRDNAPPQYFRQDAGTGQWQYMDRSGQVIATFSQRPIPDPQATPAAQPTSQSNLEQTGASLFSRNADVLGDAVSDRLTEQSGIEARLQKLPGRHNSVYRFDIMDPEKVQFLKLMGLAKTAPLVGAATQGMEDGLFRPDLSPQDRATRAGIAAMVAVPAAIATAALVTSTTPVWVAVGVSLIAGAAVDQLVKEPLFEAFGVGGGQ